MKVTSQVIRSLGILLTTTVLALSTACSSSQQDEEDLELSNEENGENQQGNLGEDDAAEGNGQENFENEEGQANENEQGAEVNSETDSEFEEGAELGNQGGGNEVFNNGGNATANAGMNTPAPVNAAPMNAGMSAPAPAPAPVASEKSPIPGGRVRYVRSGGVQVVSGPGGAPVANLEQGDHPVTWEENGWLRISNGMYVPVDAMSDKGVPRVMGQKGWN